MGSLRAGASSWERPGCPRGTGGQECMLLLDDSSLSPSCPQLPSVVGQPGDTGQAARRGWTVQNQGPAFVGVDVRAWTGLGAAPLAAGTLRPGLGHVHPAALSRARLQLPTPPPPAPRPPHCTASMPQRLTRRADSAAVCLCGAAPRGLALPARPPASHRRAQPVTRARPEVPCTLALHTGASGPPRGLTGRGALRS